MNGPMPARQRRVGGIVGRASSLRPTCAASVKSDSKESRVGPPRKLLGPTGVDYGLSREGEYSPIMAAAIDDSIEGEDRLTSRVAGTPHSELRSGFGAGQRTQAEWEVACRRSEGAAADGLYAVSCSG